MLNGVRMRGLEVKEGIRLFMHCTTSVRQSCAKKLMWAVAALYHFGRAVLRS